ncbi:2461d8e8-3d69-4add-9b41-b34b3ba55141 [Thermothielavioides terrestris]|uniref:2461d8e8-3d69-4add-9b41-b34b3ba55141 n=1 Tax=Thermothielavioides terrestris TaxID=2587410 RepID=A0A446BFN1_9PEZI|nr:2461d8e8-3d69-4add-9b41-b34b3ba55141 [Thermothielavioides terrestris]
MKYTVALLALTAGISAQDISILPECSRQCILDAIGKTSCAATDFACACKNMDVIKASATPCVVQKCGIDTALNQVLPATEKFCAAVGSGSSSSSASSSNKPTAAATTTTTAAAATASTTAPPAVEPTGATAGAAPSNCAPALTPPPFSSSPSSTSTGSPSAPGSFVTSAATTTVSTAGSTAAPSPSASVHTAGAARGCVGGLGMLVLGVVAAL